MSKILLPPSMLADAEAEREKEARRLHQKYVYEMTHRLQSSIPLLTDKHSRDAVKKMCSTLMVGGKRTRSVVHRDPLTQYEMGRVISDVLLGPGLEYEEKT